MTNAEKAHERYVWLKAHGVCVSCGQADAEPGTVRCRKCLDVRNRLSMKWKAEHRERYNAYQREYQRRYHPKWLLMHPGYYRNKKRVYEKKPVIRKPPGTCRRRGCWESAKEFSCWCPVHLEWWRERRCLSEYLSRNG